MGKRGKKHWLYVAIPYNLRVKTAGIFFFGGGFDFHLAISYVMFTVFHERVKWFYSNI